jgi:toxin ParE1/3/4
MSVIIKAPSAEKDLNEILQYISADSLHHAEQLLLQIDKKCRMLAENPLLGKTRDELKPNLRSFPISSYVIFYRSIPSGIEVVRILHGARDIFSLFQA